jgi:hypothetical protein
MTRKNIIINFLLGLGLLLGTAQAASAPQPVGDWQGTLTAGSSSLRVVLHITQDKGGALTGTLDSPDQSANGIKISSISYNNPDVKFEISSISASFEGKLNKSNEIVGNWKQIGQTFPLTFKPLK